MAATEKQVCVGVVTGPQGVTGAVRIKSFTARPEDVAGYGRLPTRAAYADWNCACSVRLRGC